MKPLFSREMNKITALDQLFQAYEDHDFYHNLQLEKHHMALLSLKDRVAEMKFRVAVIGEFSTGKSSFINALLHQNVLPASFKPTTNQVMRIESGGEQQVCISDEPSHYLPLNKENILQMASETEQPLDIYTEIPEPMSQFVVYDTPGVNDPSALTEEIIFDLLGQSDIVIFLMRSDAALKETELNFLKSLVCKKDLDKFFFVVNFKDHLDAQGIKDVRSHVTRGLAGALNSPRSQLDEKVLFCSAKQALDQVMQSNFRSESWQSFDSLLKCFQHFSQQKKEDLEAAAIHGEIKSMVQQCCQDIDVVLDVLSGKDQAYAENLQKINDEIMSFKQKIQEQSLTFCHKIREQQRTLEDHIKQDFDGLKQNIVHDIQAMSDDELQQSEWMQKMLRRDIDDQVSARLQEFWKNLEGTYGDFDKAIAPDLEQSIKRIQGFDPGFNFTPIVTGIGIAGAGYAAVTTILPWVLWTGGLGGVAAIGVACFVPGMASTIAMGASKVMGSAVKGLGVLFAGGSKALICGYQGLQKPVGNWEGSLKKKKYAEHIILTLNSMQMEAINHIAQSIDPNGLCDAYIEQKFAQKIELEQREQKVSELSQQREALLPHIESLCVFKKKLSKEL